MNKSLAIKLILPVLILLLSIVVVMGIVKNPSKAQKNANARQELLAVEVLDARTTDYQIEVDSFGVVRPRTESQLVAQVAGMITAISDQFQEGGFFEKGDVLVHIDDRDYRAAVVIAESDYVQAQSQLAEEQARSKQAEVNWRRMDANQPPTNLVLRKPQLAAAQARVDSAKARLDQARLDLDRANIKAPYAGRVKWKNVDIGQFITANTPIATIFATDYLEVRVPLSDRQREVVDIPEQYLSKTSSSITGSSPIAADGISSTKTQEVTKVFLHATVGRSRYTWSGRLSRAESALDEKSKQLNVIAQIDDPYLQRKDGAPPLKIGQFVEVKIMGRRLSNVFVLPHAALHGDDEVVVVVDQRLVRKKVDVLWEDDDWVVISAQSDALNNGAKVVTSPIGGAVEGTKVKIAEIKEGAKDRFASSIQGQM